MSKLSKRAQALYLSARLNIYNKMLVSGARKGRTGIPNKNLTELEW